MLPSRHFLVLAATMALLLLTTVAAPPPLALADDAKPDYAAAKKHYLAAEEAARAKDWAKAAVEFSVAYEITRDPVLFFKLGNAYQLSGDCTRAVEYFERYIAEAKPSEEYKSDTKSRIATCKSSSGTSAGGGTETAPTNEGTTSEVPGLEENSGTGSSDMELQANDGEQVGQPTFLDDKPSWQETAAWTSVGVSFAFLSASAILGLSANSREEDIDNLYRYRDSNGNPAQYDANIQKKLDNLVDEGEDLNTLSMVALGLAGVSTASAILFFVLDSSASKEEETLSSITPTISDESLGVAANWAF
jgi:tetratricopeptide (TPR) repeat protein